MSNLVRLMSVSLIVAAAAPAFGINMKSPEEEKAQKAKYQSMEVVSTTRSGRQVVKADGQYFIEMPGTDLNKLKAIQILKMHREQMRAALGANEDQGLTRAQLEDRAKNVHILPDRSGYFTDAFYGLTIPGLQKVQGVKFIPSRNERLENKGAHEYIVAKTEMRQGAVVTGSCGNPDGHADVMGYNRLRSGCWAALKLFKKIGN